MKFQSVFFLIGGRKDLLNGTEENMDMPKMNMTDSELTETKQNFSEKESEKKEFNYSEKDMVNKNQEPEKKPQNPPVKRDNTFLK